MRRRLVGLLVLVALIAPAPAVASIPVGSSVACEDQLGRTGSHYAIIAARKADRTAVDLTGVTAGLTLSTLVTSYDPDLGGSFTTEEARWIAVYSDSGLRQFAGGFEPVLDADGNGSSNDTSWVAEGRYENLADCPVSTGRSIAGSEQLLSIAAALLSVDGARLVATGSRIETSTTGLSTEISTLRLFNASGLELELETRTEPSLPELLRTPSGGFELFLFGLIVLGASYVLIAALSGLPLPWRSRAPKRIYRVRPGRGKPRR